MTFTEEQQKQFDELMVLGKKEYPNTRQMILEAVITRYVLNGLKDFSLEDNDNNNNEVYQYETEKREYNYGE